MVYGEPIWEKDGEREISEKRGTEIDTLQLTNLEVGKYVISYDVELAEGNLPIQTIEIEVVPTFSLQPIADEQACKKEFMLEAVVESEDEEGINYKWRKIEGDGEHGFDEDRILEIRGVTVLSRYEVKVSNEGCAEEQEIEIDPRYNCEELFIPNAFSPGSIEHDVWRFSGVEFFPVKSVEVFTRNGEKVQRITEIASDQTVVWDGTKDGSTPLPTATYYYVIKMQDGEIKTGDVSIVR